jgi:hypothetical protein
MRTRGESSEPVFIASLRPKERGDKERGDRRDATSLFIGRINVERPAFHLFPTRTAGDLELIYLKIRGNPFRFDWKWKAARIRYARNLGRGGRAAHRRGATGPPGCHKAPIVKPSFFKTAPAPPFLIPP